jgi:hypothetical protein
LSGVRSFAAEGGSLSDGADQVSGLLCFEGDAVAQSHPKDPLESGDQFDPRQAVEAQVSLEGRVGVDAYAAAGVDLPR